MTAEEKRAKGQWLVLGIITCGLLGWGAYHAIGSYFGGFGEENLRHDFRRSLMVFGFMCAFLAGWWALVLTRKPKPPRTDRPPNTKKA